ncbi:MAG: hypothetical protein JWN46_3879 [Acidimicrobiales bacterium]|jgi:hypothetical protein|nr:hypothetical protein [Acidimicrobiales bacterium]
MRLSNEEITSELVRPALSVELADDGDGESGSDAPEGDGTDISAT